MRFLWIALFLFLLVPMVEAVGMSGGSFAASSSNTTVSFSGLNATADLVSVPPGAGVVAFYNLTINKTCGSVTMPLLNVSWPNSLTYATSFPAFASCAGRTLTIANGLNVSVNVSVNASTNGATPTNPRITYPDGSSEYLGFAYDGAGIVALNMTLPGSGVSVLELDGGGSTGGSAGPGGGSGGGGGGGGVAPSTNGSGVAANTTGANVTTGLSNATVVTAPAPGAGTGTVVLEGDGDAFVFGAITLIGVVFLVLSLRGGGRA